MWSILLERHILFCKQVLRFSSLSNRFVHTVGEKLDLSIVQLAAVLAKTPKSFLLEGCKPTCVFHGERYLRTPQQLGSMVVELWWHLAC
jgi:hypothetical protein